MRTAPLPLSNTSTPGHSVYYVANSLLVITVRSSRTDLFEPTGAAHTYAKVDFLMHLEICDLSPSGE